MEVIPSLTRGMTPNDRRRIVSACAYGKRQVSALLRRSGESYAQHGVEVAIALKEMTDDASLLCVAILHDLLVHPDGERLLNEAPLTDEERDLIRRLHPLRRLHIDANTEDLDMMITAFADESRLLPLRMAHRLNDVRHLRHFPKTLRRQIAMETLHMYTAIAGRIGLHAWRHEMEDICFAATQLNIALQLQRKFDALKKFDEACLHHAKTYLQKKIAADGLLCTIEGRRKSMYSSYRKMVIKKRSLEELTDRLALRLIVPDLKDCYLALATVHACFHPIPGKLKDYIGAPKENGYRSIHTVVHPLPGVTELPIEIQIRTREMQEECEYGVPKHSTYKDYAYALHARPARVNLFRNLLSLREEAKSPSGFATALRTYFREDHIAIFDAHNSLYHLKSPASALDFVCHASGRKTAKLRSVRINGRERPPETPLHDGDTVEARFGKDRTITKSWIGGCHHGSARALLRALLKS